MSTYLPTLFGENLMDVFDDFDRDFFRGFRTPERMLYGKNAPHMMKTDEGKDGKVLRQERYAGSMSRSFYVGDHVTEEDVKARFEDGVLRLSIPKKDAKKVEEKKTILIEG